MSESSFGSEEMQAAFTRDMDAFLERMERANSAVLEAPPMSPKMLGALVSRRPFAEIEDCAQSIRGSASSLDIEAIAETAMLIEELSRRGTNALASIERQARRAHAIATFCADAIREMRAMTELSGEDAHEEASWLAMVLRDRAVEIRKSDDDDVQQTLKLLEPLPGDAAANAASSLSFSEPDGWADPELLSPDDVVLEEEAFSFEAHSEAELASTSDASVETLFEREARALLLTVRGHVETLLATRRADVISRLEAPLASLKGSAAAMSLPNLAARAGALGELLERRAEGAPSPTELAEIVASTNKLLATLAVAPVHMPKATVPPAPVGTEMGLIFSVEAQTALERAAGIVATLRGDVSRERVEPLRGELERIFHRLKGTALVVGATSIADEAEQLMAAASNVADISVLVETLETKIAALGARLSGSAEMTRSGSHAGSEVNLVSEGLVAIFREEVSETLPAIREAFRRLLDQHVHPEEALEVVARIFHTLKGAASAVSQTVLSDLAGALESSVDRIREGDTSKLDAGILVDLKSRATEFYRLCGLDAFGPLLVTPPHLTAPTSAPAPEADGPNGAPTRDGVSIEEWDGFVAACTDAIARGLDQSDDRSGDDALMAVFGEEVRDLAPVFADCFAKLADKPGDLTTVGTLERLFHTLKGSAATVGRSDLAAAAESLRSALERVQTRQFVLTTARVEALRDAVDAIVEVATRGGSEEEILLSAAEFAFEEAAEEPHRVEGNDELFEIFLEEARTALVALQGHLETLHQTPDSVYAAEYVERIFHTLKGAAATVGAVSISTKTAELQMLVSKLVAREVAPTQELVDEIIAQTNVLLDMIGLPRLAVATDAEKSDASAGGARTGGWLAAGPAERKLFLDELKATCRQAAERARELMATTDPSKGVVLRTQLSELFHRIKGTSATMGALSIAEEAERASQATRRPTPTRELVGVIGASIARIAELAGFKTSRREKGTPGEMALVREPVSPPEEGELWESFLQECSELLEGVEKAALALEESSQPKTVLEGIFRLVHTLKGAVNTVGLSPTGKVLHVAEDHLEGMLQGAVLPPMPGVATSLLEIVELVRRNLSTARRGWVETSPRRVNAAFTAARSGPKRGAEHAPSFSILDTNGMFITSNKMEDGRERSGASRRSRSAQSANQSGADFVEEKKFIRVPTERLETLMNLAGELVVSRSRLSSRVNVLKLLYGELARSRMRLSQTVEAFRSEYEFANLGGGKTTRKLALARARATSSTASEGANGGPTFGALELDEYEDIHVLSRSLAEIGSDFEEAFRSVAAELSNFAEDADSLGGIISGIQGEVSRARMIPLDVVFTRLRLPVRDAATREHKEVRVVTEGADVSVDKTIADALIQPLLHLVRNAVVHGIESPFERAAAGKDRTGILRLCARQESGQIVLEISDDGAGLNLTALRDKGVARGLIPPGTPIDDPAVKELVFASGLSTREDVGDVAGRGVGGDVARRTIERLNGDIRVETTASKGTTFVVTLPLTLAITRTLLVREGSATYAIPLYFAEHIFDAESLVVSVVGNERRVLVDDVYVPMRHLDEHLGESHVGGGPALVVRVGDDRLVLQVDAVLGQEEIVVKSLGSLLEGHPLFAGVTLRGTGELLLILDIPGLLERFGKRGRRRTDDVAGPATIPPPGAPAGGPIEFVDAQTATEAANEVPVPAPAAQLPPASPAPRAATPLPPPDARGSIAGTRVLVVDDSLSVRKVAESLLRGIGAEVVVALDGVDALAKLRGERFDIVFTDLEMPRMHGYDFIRQLRLLAAHRDLPVLVVSSRSGQKHQEHARQVGANGYLTKPFSAQSLEAAIREWVKR